MPPPMMTSASRTLTAAMIPSSRFVVASSVPMATSERRRLMRPVVARHRRRAFAERIVQELPAFVGHAGRLLNGGAEAHELAREIIERRLDLPTYVSAVIGEEQIAGDAADHGTDNRRCHRLRVGHRPPTRPPHATSCVPRAAAKAAAAQPNDAPPHVSFSDGE